jgi:hypothetical protein
VHCSCVKVFVDGGGCMCLVGVIDCLIAKLQGKFSIQGIMDNLGVVYSQY